VIQREIVEQGAVTKPRLMLAEERQLSLPECTKLDEATVGCALMHLSPHHPIPSLGSRTLSDCRHKSGLLPNHADLAVQTSMSRSRASYVIDVYLKFRPFQHPQPNAPNCLFPGQTIGQLRTLRARNESSNHGPWSECGCIEDPIEPLYWRVSSRLWHSWDLVIGKCTASMLAVV
jgi:hypothetical protein